MAGNNAKTRRIIPALLTRNLYYSIDACNLPNHIKGELYEELGIAKKQNTEKQADRNGTRDQMDSDPRSIWMDSDDHKEPPPILSRARSGFHHPLFPKAHAMTTATEEDQEKEILIKLPSVPRSKPQRISPFDNFGFDVRFSNGNTYAFDNFGDGQQIIERGYYSKERAEQKDSVVESRGNGHSLMSGIRDDATTIDRHFDSFRRSSSQISRSTDWHDAAPQHKAAVREKVDISRIHWIKFNKLIELLSSDYSKMRRITILTHTGFCHSTQLLSALSNRYFMPFPPNLSPPELSLWIEKYRDLIRFRVIATIKYWLKEHWIDDFVDNDQLQKCMLEFCESIRREPAHPRRGGGGSGSSLHAMNRSKLAEQIKKTMTEQKKKDRLSLLKLMERQKSLSDSVQIEGSEEHDASYHYVLLSSHGVEVLSDCITELCLSVFMAIKPRECVDRAWGDPQRAPNLYYMIQQHELLVAFVLESILCEEDLCRRVDILAVFIKISWQLSVDGNFHGSHAVHCGFNMQSIYRLKATWSQLHKSAVKKCEDLKHLYDFSNGRINLRNRIQEYLPQKCIPELSIIRKDLTLVEEGNESTITIPAHSHSDHADSDGKEANGKRPEILINFFKSQMLAKSIEQIKMHQQNNKQAADRNIHSAAYEYIRLKVQRWQHRFQVTTDKQRREQFMEMSYRIEPPKNYTKK